MSCQCLYTSHVLDVPHLSAEGGQEVRGRYQQLLNRTHPNGLVVGGTEELGLSGGFKNCEVINCSPVAIQSAKWFPGVDIPNLYSGHRLSSSQDTCLSQHVSYGSPQYNAHMFHIQGTCWLVQSSTHSLPDTGPHERTPNYPTSKSRHNKVA